MVIISIKRDSNVSPLLRSVTLDDGECVIAPLSVVEKFRLSEGKSLDGDELEKLRQAADLSSVKTRASKILSYRAVSRNELISKLIQNGEDEDNAEIAADWLEDLGLINDLDYGKMIARHYSAKGYGRGRVKNEIYHRGVPREFWDECLDEIPDSHDEIDRLLYKKLGGENPGRQELRRATDYLQRRGFYWDEIKDAVKRYMEDLEEGS